jgi:cytochrome c-type biogenesis protein CcmH
MLRRTLFVFIVILINLATLVTIVLAQQDTPGFPTDDDVNAVAKKLYCPVCPNTPLDVCETQACKDWRAQIRDQLSSGWSEKQILEYFVAQYGERVLAEPQRSGFTSLVWILPVIAVILGLVIIWQILIGWRKRPNQLAENVPTLLQIDPDVLAKLEKELQELD